MLIGFGQPFRADNLPLLWSYLLNLLLGLLLILYLLREVFGHQLIPLAKNVGILARSHKASHLIQSPVSLDLCYLVVQVSFMVKVASVPDLLQLIS